MPPDPATTALLVDTAQIAFIEAQIAATRQIFADDAGFKTERVGGGVAAVTMASFGRKLNHVAGFGMDGPVTVDHLVRIEELYSAVGIAPEINLCPYAHESVFEVLDARGYSVCVEMCVHTLSLHDLDIKEFTTTNPSIAITRVLPSEHDLFIRTSTLGFTSTAQPPLLLETLAKIATLRPDTTLYFARIDNKIAGCAGVAYIRTPTGNVAELYIDSTVPEFRGRGVQSALVRARLVDAKRDGMGVATATTWPVGTSARNLAREGFRVGFLKGVYTRGRA
ncbi:hypothetical protein BJX70DRAFT_361369 [Aspergillus crustosus]